MGQFKFVIWLAHWYFRTESFVFDWDVGNLTKSVRKHGITTEDVESLFELKLGVPIGEQVAPAVDEGRLCVVGPSASGKMVSVVFPLRAGHVRPISARPASRKERKLYEEIREATQTIR